MDLTEALYTTRAMRRLKPDPIPASVQAAIMDAAIRAPSGGDSQRWRFLLVDDRELMGRLAVLYRDAYRTLMRKTYGKAIDRMEQDPEADASRKLAKMLKSGQYLADHFDEVPMVLFAYVQNDPTGQSLYPAVWSAMLAARGHGVGSAFTSVLSMFAAEPTSELLGAPTSDGWTNPCAVTFGYPLGRWGRAERRPITEVTYRNRWGTESGFAPDPLWP
jgi:nitroreductase